MPRSASISDAQLRRTREAAQLLDRGRRREPFELVRRLLGVQAQVLPAAGLALAARSDGLTVESVKLARENDRSIVHTWAMRGTLHLITAEDYGWLVPLVLEPRIANSLRRLRQLGYSADKAERAARAIEQMLEREGPLTRQEVLRGLRRLRFPTEDVTTSYHLMWLANSTGGVCYGPTRKGQRCFVLFRDWVGEPRRMDPQAAPAELVVRYLASHGPARPEDLAFWSGLRLTDIRRGWRSVEDRLVEVEASAAPMWRLRRGAAGAAPAGLVRLLPNFDEYFLGWKDRGFSVEPDRWKRINQGGGWLHPVVLADGRATGLWKAERTPNEFRIKLEAFDPLPVLVRRKVDAEAARMGAFLGLPVDVREADE
jgi:winged helix DNA-binding protein